MLRAKLLIIGLGLAMVAAFAGPAYAQDESEVEPEPEVEPEVEPEADPAAEEPAEAAQDGPAITVEPAEVDAAGTHTFTVTGSGYTQPALFVLPCEFPEGGDVNNLAQDKCDLTALTPAAPDADGAFTVEVEYDVPAEGMAIVAADAGQVEQAAAVITVAGGDSATEDEAEAEETPEAEPVDEAQEELPATGSESTTLAIIGLTLAAAGALVVGGSRRLGRI